MRQSPLRRGLDVVVSGTGLLLTCWLGAMAALAVRFSSPGPILHQATRVARGGGTFTLYKFRSMKVSSTESGPAVTAGGDPRITGVGRILRATKVDEWPQLWNVLRGDMSLVGPRPEDPRYVAGYDDTQRDVLLARPGITSPASIEYRHEEERLAEFVDDGMDLEDAYAKVLADKLRIDREYLTRRTVSSDLRVIADTLAAVIRSG
ncbi:MAG: sugar transferase [Microthrixaceae bacterium]